MQKVNLKNVVDKANAKLSIKVAAMVLASSTFVSALLGIFRDRLFNANYLHTYPTGADAYTAAFVIPDFMFFILVSGALAVTFIPVFNQRMAAGQRRAAWELSSSLLNLFAIITLVASVLIIIFAESLVTYVVGAGFDEATRALAISMMRVIAINPFLFAIATVIASMQQAVGRFVFSALAPAIYNIGIIIGIVWFTGGINIFGWQVFEGGIMGVALGVVLGAAMQLVVSVIGLVGLGFDYEFVINWRNHGFRRVLKLLPARSLHQGLDYVKGLVEINIASRMASGSVRMYQQALALHMMPVNLVGVAISTAFFPKMTEDLSGGRIEEFRRTVRMAIRTIIWIAMPVAAITYFTRGYVVNFIVVGGDPVIAGILGALVVSLFARSVYHILSRSFYARQDTRTPLLVSVFVVALNIGLAITFALRWGMGVYGMAIAQSITALLEVVILAVILGRRERGLLNQEFWRAGSKMVIASALAGMVAYGMTRMMPLLADEPSFWDTFPRFALIAGVSLGVYVGLSWLLKLEEMVPVVNRVKKAVARRAK
ncbi:murein biosynthesis integral membrane protein MurJ [Candidatus Saccharibacteria bacterium]|nr:murein biosynthesis integral membrane protein MurJ [Candidatus Saccharibacteria bacterium]